MLPENAPPETKASPSWAMWKKEVVGQDKAGKDVIGKVPYQPNGTRAKSNDSSTWSTFTTAQMTYQDIGGFDGICWMMPTKPSGLIFIDIDHCVTSGIIEPWALDVVKEFDTYTEISQSGNGLHLLLNGTKPIKRCRKMGSPYEIYDCLRPCYLTGNTIEGHTTIEARQEPLNRLFETIFAKELMQANEQQTTAASGLSCLSDEAVILKATTAKNGQDFEALWEGSLLGYMDPNTGKPDESAADLALMNNIAFYCCGDKVQMERIFSASALGKREKWTSRQDYRERTISKALEGRTKFYKPKAEETDNPKELWEATPDEAEALLNAVMEERGKVMTEAEVEAYQMPSGPKFSCNLPTDHFITRFTGYGTAISDAYRVYWFMAAIFILGVIADKKLMFKTSMATFYMNVWIYILGDSSLARKTTAIQKAYDMLKAVVGSRFVNACIPNTFSPEAFTEHMSNFNHAPWIRDEAAGVLSIMQKDYMRGFKDDLMQLYDCHPITRMLRTKKSAEKSRFDVLDPYLNLFFASTGAALGYNLDLIDKETGFLARFVFAYPQDEKENYMPLDKGAAIHSELEEICISQLTTITKQIDAIPLCIDMTHSPNARAYYNVWQETRDKEAAALKDGYSSQIFSRLNPFVMKLAMAFEMGSSDFDPTRPIREEYFREACRLVDTYFMPTTRHVYDTIGTANKDNQIEKIALYLSRHSGHATRKEIMRDVKIKSKEMTEYLLTMEECEMTETKDVYNSVTKRNTSVIFLKDQRVANVVKVVEVERVEKVEDQIKEETVKEQITVPTLDTFSTNPTFSTFHGDVDEGESSSPTIRKEDPGFTKFKSGMKKRKCVLCGRTFPYDLTWHSNGDKSGYECTTCMMHGPPSEPAKADPQTELEQAGTA